MVIKGILGEKIGMTQIFKEGAAIPVTVISAGPCRIFEIKDKENFGYSALGIGYQEISSPKRIRKPILGQFKKLNLKPLKYLQELRIEDESVLEKYRVGQEIKVDIFEVGEYVDVIADSKGKGFQGGVKRWGWHIGPKSHGSKSKRAIGSVGASSDPSRTYKGLHMAGHLGNNRVTVQNLEITDLDLDKNLILLKGAVPGAKGTLLLVRSAKKKAAKLTLPELQEEKVSEKDAGKLKEDEISQKQNQEKDNLEQTEKNKDGK